MKDHLNVKNKLYKNIRCPECYSEKGLKYALSDNLICSQCKNKYPIIGGVPILLSKDSKKILLPQLKSSLGNKMVEEYLNENALFDSIKNYIKVPDLSYDLLNRRRLHNIITHRENQKYIILNIGGGPRREDKNVLNLNIDVFPNVDIVGDAHNLPIKSNSLDGVMIIAVFEHVQSPTKVVEEVYRVLKKGGYIYAETPFLQHFHGYPNHFQNFTLIGHDYLLRKFNKIESGAISGPFSTVIILILNIIEDLISNKYLRKILLMIIGTLLFPLKFLDILTKHNKNIHKLTRGVYFLGQKFRI